VLRVGFSKKLDPTLNTSSDNFAINNQDNADIKLHVNGFLRLKTWVFASMLNSLT
jgi:hypothetical protein